MSTTKTTIKRTELVGTINDLAVSGQCIGVYKEETAPLTAVQKKLDDSMVVTKISSDVLQVCSYGSVVVNRGIKEDVSESVQLVGDDDYDHVNLCVDRLKSKGTLYIAGRPSDIIKPTRIWLLNGEPTTARELWEKKIITATTAGLDRNGEVKKAYKPKTQGDIENVVKWQRHKFANLTKLNINDVEINVVD